MSGSFSPAVRAESRAWLAANLAACGAAVGTIHLRRGDRLVLAAAVDVPESVVARIEGIPVGKGMAGLAWARREPVVTCNVRAATEPEVRPGARGVDAGASSALPVFDHSGDVGAVVGFGFVEARDIDAREAAALPELASGLPALAA